MSEQTLYTGHVVGDDDDPRRRRLLAAAAEIIATSGAAGLSVRALADAVGASTKVIYTYFGGKDGVIAALYDDAFARLADRFTAAATCGGLARDRLGEVMRAYRQFALDNPDLYELMYASRIRELRPTEADRTAATPCLVIVADLVASIERTSPTEAMVRARRLWAAAHGVISLELSDWFDHAEAERHLDDAIARHLH